MTLEKMGLAIGRTKCRGIGFTRLGALLNLLCQLKAAHCKPRQIAPVKTVISNIYYHLDGSFYRLVETHNAEVMIVKGQFETHYHYSIAFGDLIRVIYAVQVGDPILYGYWKVQMVVDTHTWAAYGETFTMALFNLLLEYVLVAMPARMDLLGILGGALSQPIDLPDDPRPGYSIRTADGRLEYIVSFQKRRWPAGTHPHHYYQASLERLYL